MKKLIITLLVIWTAIFAYNETQLVWQGFNYNDAKLSISQAGTDYTYSDVDGWLTIQRSSSAELDVLYSKAFNPVRGSEFNGLLGISVRHDTVKIDTTGSPADTSWWSQKDTIWYSLDMWYQGQWVQVVDTVEWRQQSSMSTTKKVFYLPADDTKLFLYRTTPHDTTVTNLFWFPNFIYRLEMNFDDVGDSATFKTKSMWYAY